MSNPANPHLEEKKCPFKLNCKIGVKKKGPRLLYFPKEIKKIPLPLQFTLRPTFASSIPVLSQGEIGDCTAFAMGYYLQYLQQVEKKENDVPSHLFLYYNGRKIGGYPVSEDTGLSVQDICASAFQYGWCPEKMWPYLEENMPIEPTQDCYTTAAANITQQYYELMPSINPQTGKRTMKNFKVQLCEFARPLIFGIAVYQSFFGVGSDGKVPDPNPAGGDTVAGYHCILALGWNDSDRRVQCINSWGADWGDKGFFTLSYEYLLNPSYVFDFYVVPGLKKAS